MSSIFRMRCTMSSSRQSSRSPHLEVTDVGLTCLTARQKPVMLINSFMTCMILMIFLLQLSIGKRVIGHRPHRLVRTT